MVAGPPHHALHQVRSHAGVGVKEDEPPASRDRCAAVFRPGYAVGPLVHQPHGQMRRPGHEVLHDLTGGVRGAVVHDHGLQQRDRPRLRCHGCQRRPYIALLVVGGDDDRDLTSSQG